jgi:hypothetical protein
MAEIAAAFAFLLPWNQRVIECRHRKSDRRGETGTLVA